MPLLSKASNVVQNVFFLYDVTGFTQIGHSIPVATNCIIGHRNEHAPDIFSYVNLARYMLT